MRSVPKHVSPLVESVVKAVFDQTSLSPFLRDGSYAQACLAAAKLIEPDSFVQDDEPRVRMTAGELIQKLRQYPEGTPVVSYHQGTQTFAGRVYEVTSSYESVDPEMGRGQAENISETQEGLYRTPVVVLVVGW